jgi:hypothetical protein
MAFIILEMKSSWPFSFCVATVLASIAITPVKANVSSGNPYKVIASRNVFNLQPIVFSPSQAQPTPPPAKILLTGITTILGGPYVLFKMLNSIESRGPSEKFYTLTEGEIKDGVEVVQIDAKNGLVTFNNHGIVQKIPFANSIASTSP